MVGIFSGVMRLLKPSQFGSRSNDLVLITDGSPAAPEIPSPARNAVNRVNKKLVLTKPQMNSTTEKLHLPRCAKPTSLAGLPRPMRRCSRDGNPPAVKIIEQRVGLGIIFLQAGRSVLRLRAGHVQIAVRAEIPHRQFGEEFVRVRAGV